MSLKLVVVVVLQSDCTDALKNSLAAALRHSREQAQRTYDRRTANEKKQMAVELAKGYAESRLGLERDEDLQEGPSTMASCHVKVGDFVGLIEEGSTQNSPKILIGQVQSFVGHKEAHLLWYEKVKTNLYKLELDGQPWIEPIESLVCIQVQAVKSPPGLYKLLTTPRQIHRDLISKA